MAYCTADDLKIPAGGEKGLKEIADQDGNGFADTDVMARAIEQASSDIDDRLAKQYAVPLATVPAGIKNRCASLAVYYMRVWKARGLISEADREWLKNFLEELDGYAKNSLAPSDPAPTKATTRIDAAHRGEDQTRGIWRGKYKGYT